MDKIKSIWVLLSDDATLCCNEPKRLASAKKDFMSLELLTKIAERVVKQSWNCTIIGNATGIPKAYQTLSDKMGAIIVLPAEYKGTISNKHTTVVFELSQIGLAAKHSSASRAILRVQRSHLSELSEMVLTLLHHFPDVSIKHPEVLSYDDQDMATYKDHLFEIGRWLLSKKNSWSNYRVDCLTDGFHLDTFAECGAGIKSLAVGPTGKLHICPATVCESTSACGHIIADVELPNRHLLTREYSVPCGKCNALHCSRCVYLNKRGTFEFGVPPKNICQLANFELEVQAWFSQEAIKMDLWKQSYNIPQSPLVYDPYELVKVEETPPIVDSWRRLVRFDGHLENLQTPMMLDIIHRLQGWCQALEACAEAGYIPSIELMEQDVLDSLRRRTIEQYRDMSFQKDCPTIREIELLMCSVVLKSGNLLRNA